MEIYRTTNLMNGKVYIGKSMKSNPNYIGSGVLLRKAIRKYGRQSFRKDVLEQCLTKDELNSREKHWILELNSLAPVGYNLTRGGDGGDTFSGRTHTLETRARIQATNKKTWSDPLLRKSHGERTYAAQLARGLDAMARRSLWTPERRKQRAAVTKERWKGDQSVRIGKMSRARMKAVVIDGVEYCSIDMACKALGLSRYLLKQRLCGGN